MDWKIPAVGIASSTASIAVCYCLIDNAKPTRDIATDVDVALAGLRDLNKDVVEMRGRVDHTRAYLEALATAIDEKPNWWCFSGFCSRKQGQCITALEEMRGTMKSVGVTGLDKQKCESSRIAYCFITRDGLACSGTLDACEVFATSKGICAGVE